MEARCEVAPPRLDCFVQCNDSFGSRLAGQLDEQAATLLNALLLSSVTAAKVTAASPASGSSSVPAERLSASLQQHAWPPTDTLDLGRHSVRCSRGTRGSSPLVDPIRHRASGGRHHPGPSQAMIITPQAVSYGLLVPSLYVRPTLRCFCSNLALVMPRPAAQQRAFGVVRSDVENEALELFLTKLD